MSYVLIKNKRIVNVVKRFLDVINRFSHWIDVVIYYFIAVYLNNTLDFSFRFLIFALPIFQLWRNIKWEWRCYQSKQIILETSKNKRVQGFSGCQGAGKTSFMLFCAYVIKPSNCYTNFPAKLRSKFTSILDNKVLEMYEKIPDNSLLCIDEVTMLYHNLMYDIKNPAAVTGLYAQQLQQQIVRHCYDGNMFYSSVDLNRMPQMLKENIGLTNYMLGQGSVTLSYLTSMLVSFIGSMFGLKYYNSIRYWDVQQLERIPEVGYTFDLSRQEKDTNTKNYANLIRFCCFNSHTRFDYDDRFLRGIYVKLVSHINKYWNSLDFDEKLLREIGYGQILSFFNKRIVNEPEKGLLGGEGARKA